MNRPRLLSTKAPRFGRRAVTMLAVTSLSLGTLALPFGGLASAAPSGSLQADFSAAAQEYHVPENVLLAVSYNQTRWENHNGQPSAQGGYGVMHLTAKMAPQNGRGDQHRPMAKNAQQNAYSATIDAAANLSHQPVKTVQTNDRANIRAAAALLANKEKILQHNQLPTDAGAWYSAVARMSGASNRQDAEDFVSDVFTTLSQGASRTTSNGQQMTLAATKAQKPSHVDFGKWHLKAGPPNQAGAECPQGLGCRFAPAAYEQNNPNDKVDYGNYDQATRPDTMQIRYIVIHDTEGSYDSAISSFQDPHSYTSAHYVIRSSDGQITQMVHNKDVAWHAGNWYTNMHSIGIEHEGFEAQGATWYSEAMYRSSARLVQYLAARYHIPLDRQHIIGHEEVQAPSPDQTTGMHTDPGPFWDWHHYMSLVRSGMHYDQTRTQGGNSVTIDPKFSANQQPTTDCAGGTCTPLPAQGSNILYLHTQPNKDAPLITDKVLHEDGSAGTTNIADMAAKVSSGEKFAVAGRQGGWTAIWFAGQKAWFYNPHGSDRTAKSTREFTITPKSGKNSVPVYGRAYPEASAYPSDVPQQTLQPLPYTIQKDQRYVVTGVVPTDYFYASTFDHSAPGDHTIVKGHDRYYPISFNHRQGFVKASDVDFMAH